jgi:hypothetical protein
VDKYSDKVTVLFVAEDDMMYARERDNLLTLKFSEILDHILGNNLSKLKFY